MSAIFPSSKQISLDKKCGAILTFFGNKVEEKKNKISNSFESNLFPTIVDIEKEAEEISLLNIDNIKNIIFLQL